VLREGGGEAERQWDLAEWDGGAKFGKHENSTLQSHLGYAERRCFVVPKGHRSSKHYHIIWLQQLDSS